MGIEEHSVAVVGGGPTGMVLGAELTLAGVDAVVLERGAEPDRVGARSGGLHARTIEVLDQRGVGDRVVAAGRPMQVNRFVTTGTTLDIGDFPSRRPYGLALWQNRFEEILRDWIAELGVRVIYGREVAGLAQDAAGVDLALAGGGTLRAGYVVGCDGGRSTVRKAAGIDFPGLAATVSSLVAEIELDEPPEPTVHSDERGVSGIGPLGDGLTRAVVCERELRDGDDPTLEDLRAAMVAVWGTDFGLRAGRWISRFTDASRHAATYRAGRVLLAGDSAHIHPPVGGQGLNTGIQDAANLGFKLALVAAGTAPESLLDSYEAERHPVAARVQRNTAAMTALVRGDERTAALREAIDEILQLDEARRAMAGALSGLDIRYDLGDGHPLLGRRMPDLDIATADGPRTVFELLHRARPALLNLGAAGALDAGPWADRVPVVDATCDGPWELPVIGAVPAPAAVLVRPDGHVAWVGTGDDSGLADALDRWFGPAAPSTAAR